MIALLLTLLCATGHAAIPVIHTGDILVQSAACKLCTVIEAEEGGPYSHMGIAVVYPDDRITVLDSWGEVEEIPLSQFLSHRKKGAKTLILRSKDTPSVDREKLLATFRTDFIGRNYDSEFLWDNKDDKGELLYCSEMVAKLMNGFLKTKVAPKEMHFDKRMADWQAYYGSKPVPTGKLGISPMDFVKSKVFRHLGEF